MLTVGQLLMLYAKYPMPKTIIVNLFTVKNHLECAPTKHLSKIMIITRKYILGVLKHTTAKDRHWGGNETLKSV